MTPRVALLVAGIAAVTIVSCGLDKSAAPDSLPAVSTTTTTTTTMVTTTTIPDTYTVQPGDILSEIVKKFRISLDEVMALNGITNPDKIFAGQKLKIPRSGSTVPEPSVTTNTASDGLTTTSTGTTVKP